MSRIHGRPRFGPASPLPGGGLLLGIALLLLAGCLAPRAQTAERTAASASSSCTSYKVGEARNVRRANAPSVTRRMGGHFYRARNSAPGETNVIDIEVYRYEDPMCASGRVR